MNATRTINTLTAALVIFLALSAFVLSYDALRALAAANGIAPGFSYLWPLTLDGFIIVASLSVLRNGLLAEKTIYAWLLIIGFSLASTTFNIVHAQHNLTAQAIAAVPPLALLLSFELLMTQFKSEVGRQAKINSLAELQHQVANRHAKLSDLETQHASLETQYASLAVKHASLETQHASLETQHANLETQHVDLDTSQHVERCDAKKVANSEFATANSESGDAACEFGNAACESGDAICEFATDLQVARNAKQQQIQARRNIVLQQHQQGLSKTEIARLLEISPDTVRRDLDALNGRALQSIV